MSNASHSTHHALRILKKAGIIMTIYPLLITGSPDIDRMFFNGGLARIKNKLYCSARYGHRKYPGTDRVEVLSDAALFSLDINNLSDCNNFNDLIDLMSKNNPSFDREEFLYCEMEKLEEEGKIYFLPGAGENVCREDHRFVYLGYGKWAFIYNIWKYDSPVYINEKPVVNTATEIVTGNPEKMLSDAEFFSPIITGGKHYGTGAGELPYKSLLFGPVFLQNEQEIIRTDKLAGRFRPMDSVGEYRSVEGTFDGYNFLFKDTGIMNGMNHTGEHIHVSPSSNPLLMEITDKKGKISWFNLYMDHGKVKNFYYGHFQITDLSQKNLLYFEKEPSLHPLKIIEITKKVKYITEQKIKGIENVTVPYGLVSADFTKEQILLISHGVSDSFWQLSGIYAMELIEKIKREMDIYGAYCADPALISIFKHGIKTARFINYNDL